MNKLISFGISLLFWVVLIVAQSFMFSFQGTAPSPLDTPDLYYSLWCLDLYLILLYYCNYYVIAPMMIRRRLFRPYIYISAIAMVLALVIPYFLFLLKGWGMPETISGQAPISLMACFGALAVIAISLALRSVVEWTKAETDKKEVKALQLKINELELKVLEQNKELIAKSQKLSDVEDENQSLKAEVSDLQKDLDMIQQEKKDLEEDLNTCREAAQGLVQEHDDRGRFF